MPVDLCKLVDEGYIVKKVCVADEELVLEGGVLADLDKKVEDEEEDIE